GSAVKDEAGREGHRPAQAERSGSAEGWEGPARLAWPRSLTARGRQSPKPETTPCAEGAFHSHKSRASGRARGREGRKRHATSGTRAQATPGSTRPPERRMRQRLTGATTVHADGIIDAHNNRSREKSPEP